ATLVVLLTGTLLFWDTSPGESESIPISIAVIPRITQAIEVESVTEVAAALPTQTAVDEVVVAEAAELAASEAVDLDESAAPTSATATATATTEEKAVAVETVAAVNSIVEINVPELAVSTEVTESIVEVAVVKETAVITATSTFVEQLLQASPGNYAVQLLASHSEANINEFVAQLGGDHPAGYFETRYRGKPWFVAVLAAFDDRDKATRAIASLPAELRSNEPWIRSMVGIQTDIRELLGSKLVSVK
ncbi:MAG: SPOR domain-containing protein, partial [Gammaproteobacteria bacterium]|nr:SPOR domain-containing protein [Gammaproteobacteria bacterium]